MNRLKKAIMAGLAIIIALTLNSCDKNTGSYETGKKPITFFSIISGNKQSKASGTSWSNDDIGIYMVKSGLPLETANILGQNKKYSTAGDGIFNPAGAENELYFPYNGDKVDFISYYPFKTNITDHSFSVDVSNQSNLSAIDILYSNNAVKLSKDNNTANLAFSHMLCNLVFEVANQTGENVSDLKVTVTGMKTSAVFSLKDGSLTDDNASIKDILAQVAVTGSKAISEIIILPAKNITGAKVKFDVPSLNRYYEWIIPEGQTFLGKNRYTYEIKLEGETLVVVNPKGIITAWVDNPKETITLDPIKPIKKGDGSFDNPLTTDQLNESADKTGQWVIGYVAGVSSATRSGRFTKPFTSKNNILIADKIGESDFAKCYSVELLDASDIQTALNLVDNEDLLGKQIKVKGNIVKNSYGTYLGIVEVTDQSGGKEIPINTDPVEYFYENFGSETSTSYKNIISQHADWKMGSPIKYSDPFNKAEIKTTIVADAHLWLPSSTDAQLKIENIPANYREISLTFQIAANKANANASCIIIKANGEINISQPNQKLVVTNSYYDIELKLPDKTTTLEFFGSSTVNTYGIRIDNIKLTGKPTN